MGGLEDLELAEKAVVLRVGDLRRVESLPRAQRGDIVGIIGALDLLAQDAPLGPLQPWL
jgi:hypothetical protein